MNGDGEARSLPQQRNPGAKIEIRDLRGGSPVPFERPA